MLYRSDAVTSPTIVLKLVLSPLQEVSCFKSLSPSELPVLIFQIEASGSSSLSPNLTLECLQIGLRGLILRVNLSDHGFFVAGLTFEVFLKRFIHFSSFFFSKEESTSPNFKLCDLQSTRIICLNPKYKPNQ